MKKPFFLLFAATLLFSCGLSIVNPSEVLSEEIDSSNTTSEKEEVTSITTSSEIITSIEYSSVEENTSIPETSEVTCEIDTYWNPTYFVAEKGYIYCDFNCAVDWDMVYMYAWNAVGTGLDTSCTIWPGAQMTKDEITGYFKCYIGDDIMAANIILSNGEENKTETLAYYSHAPLLVFIDNSLNYKWLNINHEEPFSEWLISINMIDFIELEDWSNGTSHPELPTGSEDLTISSSGTPIGSYSLNTGKFYHNIDTTTGEPIATWRIY
ncbi:MAG: starch-binding protein, partial [Bacilli bacterium]